MTAPEPTLEELATRVDAAVAAVAALDGPARSAAQELQAAVEAVHRDALVRIVRRLRADDAARPVLFELVDDPSVHMVLALHGIVRPDPATSAQRALAGVRPQLHSHGGDVTLVAISAGVAQVRLEGACNGCSMSSVTLRTLVEGALLEVAGVSAVEVLPTAPSPTLISPESLFRGPDPEAEGWVKAAPAADVPPGAVVALRLTTRAGAATEVVVVNVAQRLTAYENACAHEGLPLDNALLDVENGTLTCPWHGFCYDATSGECLSAPGAQLAALPLRVDDGHVWIRVDG